MIRAKITLVAEGVTIDRESNVASVFNIIEGAQGAGFPLYIQKLVFFCLLERAMTDPAQVHGEFTVVHDDQAPMVRQEFDINFLDQARNRSAITVAGLVFQRPGRVVFRLSLPGHGRAEYDFEVSGPPAAVVQDTH